MPIPPPDPPSGKPFLTEFEENSAKWRTRKAGNLNPPPPPITTPTPPTPAAPAEAAVLGSAPPANSHGNDPTLPQSDGTDQSDASRQSGEKPAPTAKTPPVSTKIVEKSQQGVTGDAESASPVDLAAGSVPSPTENRGGAGAPPVAATKPAKKKKSKSGITIRLNDEDRRRLDAMTEGGKSAASVMLEAFRNSAHGSVPAVNHQLRDDLLRLVKILDDLTEHIKTSPNNMKLSPILLAIKEKLFELQQDLIESKPPDATALALDRLVKEVTFIKDNTFYTHNPRRKIAE